jgi:hypothetical protein
MFKEKISGKVVLKVDVEEFEYAVLKGAKGFIKRNSPEISIEILGSDKDKTEKFLKSLGYSHVFGELWKK